MRSGDAQLDPLVSQARSCHLTTSAVLAIKQCLIARYTLARVRGSLIREAIADAEARAWLTGFPHLFLPNLADEILRQKQTRPDFAQAA